MAKICSVVTVVVTTVAMASASSAPTRLARETINRTGSDVQPLAEPLGTMTFCGVDLLGTNLWNGRYSNPDGCLAPCTPESGCNGVAWTNFEGGTCWFKSLGDVWENSTPSVGAVSFIRRYWGRPMMAGLRPAYDIDMPGNDIGSAAEPQPNYCINHCSDNPFCFATTWTNYNGGTCWLKSRASPYVSLPGARGEYVGRATNPNTCLVK